MAGIVRYSYLLEEYGIARNRLRLCHFLAQAAHETAGFRTLTEYGSTRYFNRRYGHRRDLGNRQYGDGARFRGRGIFQLTGRNNYRRYGRIVGIDLEARPLWAKRPEISLKIACEYWRRNDLNRLADRNDIVAITRRINGGRNGLRGRQRYFRRALSIWASDAEPGVKRFYLRFGDRGDQVRQMQSALHRLGYRLAVDGLFGSQTLRVLRSFQRSNALRVDGIYGPRSRQALSERLKNLPPSHSSKPKEKWMTQWKSYLHSRTIWANLIGFGALALDIFGFGGISAEDQSQLVDQLLKLIQAGGLIAGILFRAIARDRLGPFLI